MNETLRHSAAHVFIDGVGQAGVGERIPLDPSDTHHLRRVLRLGASAAITISDGAGAWATARLVGEDAELTASPMQEQPQVATCVVSAIPKGDRVDTLVEKLTELGVGTIVLADMARSVVRWDTHRADRQRQRLTRIARQAAAQSRRVWLPQIVVGEALEASIARPGATLADPAGRHAAAGTLHCLIVGPEGGFTSDEIAAANDVVTLGRTVLRVETAAIVAGFLVTHHC